MAESSHAMMVLVRKSFEIDTMSLCHCHNGFMTVVSAGSAACTSSRPCCGPCHAPGLREIIARSTSASSKTAARQRSRTVRQQEMKESIVPENLIIVLEIGEMVPKRIIFPNTNPKINKPPASTRYYP